MGQGDEGRENYAIGEREFAKNEEVRRPILWGRSESVLVEIAEVGWFLDIDIWWAWMLFIPYQSEKQNKTKIDLGSD